MAPPPPLRWEILDRTGAKKASLVDRRPGSSIELRWNGFVLANVVVPFSSPDIAECQALTRRLQVRYGTTPILVGPIIGPNGQDPAGGGEATAEMFLTARDPLVQLEATYFDGPGYIFSGYNTNSPPVGPMTAALIAALDQTSGKGHGVLNPPGTVVNYNSPSPAPGDVFWRWTGGDNIHSVIELVLGMDTVQAVWPTWTPNAASCCSLAAITGTVPWVDRRDSVIFEYGFGKHTAIGFYDSPAGEETCNRVVIVGTTTDGVNLPYTVAEHATSKSQLGNWEKWLNVDDTQFDSPHDARVAMAKAIVKEAAYPPQHFDFIPAPPRGTQSWGTLDGAGNFVSVSSEGLGAGPLFAPAAEGGDFWFGDIIRVRAKRDGFVRDYVGQVQGATLTENEQGVPVPNIECEPMADWSAGITTFDGNFALVPS